MVSEEPKPTEFTSSSTTEVDVGKVQLQEQNDSTTEDGCFNFLETFGSW